MNSNAIKILICGTEKYQRSLIEEELTRSFRNLYLALVDNVGQARIAIKNDQFDFLIIDVEDDFSWDQFISSDNTKEHIIILTGSTDMAVDNERVTCLVKTTAVHQELPEIIREQLKVRLRQCRKELKNQKNGNSQSDSDIIKITTGTLSHQVNNPLMTILGLTELILEENGDNDDELTRRIKIIRGSAQKIQSSLKELSEISKPNIRQTVSGPMLVVDRSELVSEID